MNKSDPLPKIDNQNASRIGVLALTAAVLGGLLICALLAAPFLGALTWAFTLTVLFAPLQARLEKILRHPGIAAVVTVLVAVVVVAVPVALVLERLVHGAISSATFIQSKLASGTLRLPSAVGWVEQQIDLPGILNQLISVLSNVGALFLRGSLAQGLEILLTFYILFYFLRDRHVAGNVLREILPLTPEETEQLFRRMIDTVHAIIYGTITVAVLQGTLAGLMFWALGLPAPLFWGVVMSLLSIIPVLGAFVVWIPEAVYLALEGQEVKAVILALWGALVVGEIDNVVRPILVGNRLKLHTIPAFIAIIGGLILFGAPGFVLGPTTVTVTLFLLSVFRQRVMGPGP
ncbi:MAG TPA: AI-2E family transporter [Acidocella sp.]|nr:AI-2E family transporter [Acidocella sp.]